MPPTAFHVTVAFGSGYGKSFSRLDAALAYAEAQMQTLLLDHEELEKEDFDGIYCEREGVEQYSRFDHVDGAAAWVPLVEGAGRFAARVDAIHPGPAVVVVAAADLKRY
jgi:hypothetical protein